MNKKEKKQTNSREKYELHEWKDNFLPFIAHANVSYYMMRGNWHDSIEILYIIEGTGSVICDAQETDFVAGDIIIINSNELHLISSKTKPVYHCFIIGLEFFKQNGFDIEKFRFATKFNDDEAAKLIIEAIRYFKQEDKSSRFFVPNMRSIALLLASRLYTYHSEKISSAKKSVQKDYIKKGLEYINENYCSPLTLEVISQNINISKYHFLREFKLYTGYTATKYISILRCEQAKKLLETNDYAVSEVANMVGYENLSHFSKTFKAYSGLLPSEYRIMKNKSK